MTSVSIPNIRTRALELRYRLKALRERILFERVVLLVGDWQRGMHDRSARGDRVRAA